MTKQSETKTFQVGQKIKFWSERTMVPVEATIITVGRKYLTVRAYYTPTEVKQVRIFLSRVCE